MLIVSTKQLDGVFDDVATKTGLEPANYNVQVRDENGCTASEVVTVASVTGIISYKNK